MPIPVLTAYNCLPTPAHLKRSHAHSVSVPVPLLSAYRFAHIKTHSLCPHTTSLSHPRENLSFGACTYCLPICPQQHSLYVSPSPPPHPRLCANTDPPCVSPTPRLALCIHTLILSPTFYVPVHTNIPCLFAQTICQPACPHANCVCYRLRASTNTPGL